MSPHAVINESRVFVSQKVVRCGEFNSRAASLESYKIFTNVRRRNNTIYARRIDTNGNGIQIRD